MSSTQETLERSRLASVRANWLSPRRKRFWAIVAVVLYTLLGFFAVPPLLRSMTVDTLRETTGREATIGEVRFNPYVLCLEVNEFALQDTDGKKLAAFDRLFVNLQLSSLFRWAWTLREFRVDGLNVLFERFAPGDSRLTRLLADMEERAEPEPADEEPGGLPRLLIYDLTLGDGVIRFRDDVPAEPVDLALGPVTVSMQELNTLPDRYGQQVVQIRMPNDTVISWQGTIDLGPLQTEGSFSIEGSHLEQTTTYLKATLPLEEFDALLSAQTRYRISELDDGSLDVELDGLEATLSEISAFGLTPSAEFLAIDEISLSGGVLRYPENTLTLSSVRVAAPKLVAWLDEAGEVNLLQLIPQDTLQSGAENGGEGDAPDLASGDAAWRLGIDELTLADGQVSFADRRLEPQAALDLQNLQVTLSEVTNEENAPIPISMTVDLGGGGQVGFEGSLTALPEFESNGSLTLGGIPLNLAQPYVQQFVNVRLEEGTLDANAEVMLRPDQSVAVSGDLAVNGLAIHDATQETPLVGWDRFSTDRFEADTAGSTLELSKLTFDQPYGRLVIFEDQSTNLSGLMVESEVEPSAEAPDAAADEAGDAPDAAGYAVVIGGIEVQEGGLDFTDRSLPLPFATEIRELGGTISTIATASTEPAEVRLEGKVDEYGLARIEGGLSLLDPIRNTDITMEFRNLLMSNLSPYTAEFAGREIAEGKLDLDLNYVIDDGLMKGQNDIVMSDLVLGDKVDNPDAASLPLGLAVALLKDADGVIDIELPVEGDVNDPKFRIGGVIWQAFVGLVTKIVSAPFRLLGNLIGADTEDLGQFQYLAGRSDLTPPELEKIGLLQQAMQKRPELVIEVSGGYLSDVDVPALQYQRLRDEVLSRLGQAPGPDGQDIRMLDQQLRSTLEALFAERFPETPLESLKAAHSAAPPDDPEGEPVLDDLAYAAELRDRLLAAQEITQADLEALADERARAIFDAFLQGGEFGEDRIQVTEPKETESEDGEWVLMELGVAME